MSERSLAPTANALFVAWTERTGIAVEVWALADQAVPPKIADGLLRALAEALAAIEEGVWPRAVAVALTSGPRGVRLTVSHDGAGEPWPGSRLAVLHATFLELGGRVNVTYVPGGGTTLTGTIAADRLGR
ncbi:hypothetical protein [Nonomuraea coxensis]|uniref:hypothetical protein n=1 Tax=Nonomuraea coxensis TaxID=404386 RepID=UPI00036D552D|nr:hypothetical protein [Nonomuraea coxensis]